MVSRAAATLATAPQAWADVAGDEIKGCEVVLSMTTLYCGATLTIGVTSFVEYPELTGVILRMRRVIVKNNLTDA